MAGRSQRFTSLAEVCNQPIPEVDDDLDENDDDDGFAEYVVRDLTKEFSNTEKSSGRMKVFLRIRPVTERDSHHHTGEECLAVLDEKTVQTNPPSESKFFKNHARGNQKTSYQFSFSKIFDQTTSQSDFFQETMLELTQGFIKGENSMVFSYGVTNSGKTYTMQVDAVLRMSRVQPHLGHNQANSKWAKVDAVLRMSRVQPHLGHNQANREQHQAGIVPRTLDYLFNNIEHIQNEGVPIKPTMFSAVVPLSPAQYNHEIQVKNSVLKMAGEDDCDVTNLLAEDMGSDISHITNMTTCSESSAMTSQCNVDDERSSTESFHKDVDMHDATQDESVALKYAVWVNFAEIYNEQIYDLLEDVPSNKTRRLILKLSEDKAGCPYIKGLKDIEVNSPEEALRLMVVGQRNLRKASTFMNRSSSRSHAIFTIKLIRTSDVNDPTAARVSMMSLCDLAGSERQGNTRVSGERLKEAGNINTSLLCLGRCIETLRNNQTHSQGLMIPFRNSKLTRLFQNFFVGSGRAVMIVNVNTLPTSFDEMFHVLKFSTVAKQVMIETSKPDRCRSTRASTASDTSERNRGSIAWGDSAIIEEDEIAEDTESNGHQGTDDSSGDESDEYDSKVLLGVIEEKNAAIKQLMKEKRSEEWRIRVEVTTKLTDLFKNIENTLKERLREAEEDRDSHFEKKIRMLLECQPMDNACKQKMLNKPSGTDDESMDDDDDNLPSVVLCKEMQKYAGLQKILEDTESSLSIMTTKLESRDKTITQRNDTIEQLRKQMEAQEQSLVEIRAASSIAKSLATVPRSDKTPVSSPVKPSGSSVKATKTSLLRQKNHTPKDPTDNQRLCVTLGAAAVKLAKLPVKTTKKLNMSKKVKRLSVSRQKYGGLRSTASGSQLSRTTRRAPSYTNELEEAHAEINRLRGELESNRDMIVSSTSEGLEATSRVSGESDGIVESSSNECAKAEADENNDVFTPSKDYQDLKVEFDQIKMDMEKKEREIAELKMKMSRDKSDFDQQEKALIHGYTTEIEKYKQEVFNLKKTQDDDSKTVDEESKIHEDGKKQDISSEDRARLDQYDSSEDRARLDQYETMVTETEEFKEDLLKQLTQLQKELKKRRKSEVEKDSSLIAIKSATRDLEDQLEAETDGRKNAEKHVQELEAELEKVKGMLSDGMKSDNDCLDLMQNRMAVLETEGQEKDGHIEKLDQELETAKGMLKERMTTESESLDRIQERMEGLETDGRDKDVKIEELEGELERLKSLLNEAKCEPGDDTLEKMRSRVRALEEVRDKGYSDIETLQKKLGNMEDLVQENLNTENSYLFKMENRVEDLETEGKEKENELVKLQEERHNLVDKTEKLNRELAEQESKFQVVEKTLADSIGRLENENSKLKKQIEDIVEKSDSNLEDFNSASLTNKAIQKENDDLKLVIVSLESDARKSDDTEHQLELEVKGLKQKISNSEDILSKNNDVIVDLQKKLTNYDILNDDLNDELAQSKVDSKELSEIKNSFVIVQEENAQLKAKVSTTKQKKVGVKGQLLKEKNNMDEKIRENENLNKKYKEAELQKEILHKRFKELESASLKTSGKLELEKSSLKSKTKEVESLWESVEKAEKENGLLKERIRRLEERNEQQKTDHKELETQSNDRCKEIQNLTAELDKSYVEVSRLKREVISAKNDSDNSISDRLQGMSTNISSLSSENTILLTQIKEYETRTAKFEKLKAEGLDVREQLKQSLSKEKALREMAELVSKTVGEKNVEIKELNSSVESLKRELQDLTERHKENQGETDELCGELQQVKADLEKQEDELENAQNQLEDAYEETSKVEIKLQEAIAEREKTIKELEIVKADIVKFEKVESQLTEVTAEREKALTDLEKMKSDHKKSENLKFSKVESELKLATEERETALKELDEVKTGCNKSDSDLKKLKADLKISENDRKKLTQDYSEAQNELEKISVKLSENKNELQIAMDEHSKAKQDLENSASDLYKTRSELDNVKADHSKIKNQFERVSEEASDYKHELEKMRNEVRDADTIQSELASTKDEVKTITDKLKTAENLVDEKKNEIVTVKQQLDNLTEKSQTDVELYRQEQLKVQHLEKETEKQERDLNNVYEEFEDLKLKHENLKTKLESETERHESLNKNDGAKLDKLKLELQSAKEEMTKKDMQVKSHMASREDMVSKVAQEHLQLEALKKELEKSKENLAQLTALTNEQEKAMEAQDAMLTRNGDKITALQTEIETLNKEKTDLSSGGEVIKNQLTEENLQKSAENKKNCAEIEKLVSENEKLSIDKKNLNEQVSVLNDARQNTLEHGDAQISELTKKLQAETEKLNKSSALKQKLETKVKEHSWEIKELEKLLSESRDKCAIIKTEQMSQNNGSAEVGELRAKLQSKDKTNFDLQKEITRLQGDLSRAGEEKENELRTWREQRDKIVNGLEGHMRKLDEENKHLKKELTQLQSSDQSSRSRSRRATNLSNDEQQELIVLRKQVESEREQKLEAVRKTEMLGKAKDQIIADLKMSNSQLTSQLSGVAAPNQPVSMPTPGHLPVSMPTPGHLLVSMPTPGHLHVANLSDVSDADVDSRSQRRTRKRRSNEMQEVKTEVQEKKQPSRKRGKTSVTESVTESVTDDNCLPQTPRKMDGTADEESGTPRLLRSTRKRGTRGRNHDTGSPTVNGNGRRTKHKRSMREKLHTSAVKLLDAVLLDNKDEADNQSKGENQSKGDDGSKGDDRTRKDSSNSSKQKKRKMYRPEISAPFECAPYSPNTDQNNHDSSQKRLRSRNLNT